MKGNKDDHLKPKSENRINKENPKSREIWKEKNLELKQEPQRQVL